MYRQRYHTNQPKKKPDIIKNEKHTELNVYHIVIAIIISVIVSSISTYFIIKEFEKDNVEVDDIKFVKIGGISYSRSSTDNYFRFSITCDNYENENCLVLMEVLFYVGDEDIVKIGRKEVEVPSLTNQRISYSEEGDSELVLDYYPTKMIITISVNGIITDAIQEEFDPYYWS